MSINNYIIDKIMYSNKNNINNISTVNNEYSNNNKNQYNNNNKNKNKNNKINIKQHQISVSGGKKMSSNIFDSKLKNKEIFNDIIPLVNSLFNIYITSFTFSQQQSLFIENNELKLTKDMSNNHNTQTRKQYINNKLTNFKIFENVLIKCKILYTKDTINFNNIKNYNYVANFNILNWKLLDDINIILKYNTSYYCIELHICSNKEISNNKYKKLNYIVDNFIKLLLYIQEEK